jgi:hypothetical protein
MFILTSFVSLPHVYQKAGRSSNEKTAARAGGKSGLYSRGGKGYISWNWNRRHEESAESRRLWNKYETSAS